MRLILLLMPLLTCSAFSQEKAKKFNHSVFVGFGRTWFDFNTGNFAKYPAVEGRLGWNISRQVSERISIKSGITLGVRAKRSSYMNGNVYTGPGIPLLSVDETASELSHFWVGLPLLIEYKFASPIRVQTGILGRDWLPTQLNGDILRSQKEIGLFTGISHKLKRKLNIGVEWYFGFTKISGGSIYDGSSNLLVDFSVRNQSICASLSYRFKE